MIEAFVHGFTGIFTWPAFGLMLIGITIGFLIGLLPGLGSVVTLALMLPFVFAMTPLSAFAFLLGMYSVTNTTGDITAILFGVPGETPSAALVVDGHAMAKNGEAGRALGAALFSSFIGAIVGALALAVSIPIIQPLILSFGPPQLFALSIVGVSLIASLSGASLLRGLIAGLFGFLLATIGMDPITSVARYTLDEAYLLGGLPIVPPVIGLFAIPEIIDLFVRGGSIAQSRVSRLDNAFQGVRDTFRHFGLTVRCALIGAFVGMLPGLGGGVGQWIAYGHAVQGAKDKTRFGQGCVEGVIAPGAANNSTAGGALIPTVVFGVPGSVVMAVLLGAFIITGIAPGPDMLTQYLDVTYSLVWIVILSNLIAVPLCFLLLNHLAKITYVRGTLLIPFLLLLVFIGAFVSTNNIVDLLVVLIFGVLGYAMAVSNWPRPPLLLGLVLGKLAESNLWISVQRDGLAWLADPMVLILLFVGLASFAYPIVRARSQRHAETQL